MKKCTWVIIGMAILLGISSCKKQSCQDVSIDAGAHSFFFSYHAGSYWVFQDGLGDTDSTWVSSTDSGYVNCNQNCIWNLASTATANGFMFNGVATTPTGVAVSVGGEGGCLNLYFQNGAIDTTPNPYISYMTLSNYPVNQYTFPSALKISTTSCGNLSYMVLVPNIGIVEKGGLFGYGAPFKLVRYLIK